MSIWKKKKSLWRTPWGKYTPDLDIVHGWQVTTENTGPGAIGISEFVTIAGGYVTGNRVEAPIGIPPAWVTAGVVRTVGAGGEFIDGYWFPQGTNVVEGAEITSEIDVYGNTSGSGGVGIVFRGCKIRRAFSTYCIYARSNCAMKIMVSYCDIGGTESLHGVTQFRSGYLNVSESLFIIKRNYLSHSENAGEVNGNIIIEENFYEHPYYGLGVHNDGWQFEGGIRNITVRRNKVLLNTIDPTTGQYLQQTGCVSFFGSQDAGGALRYGYDNVVLEDNFFAGGSYSLYAPTYYPIGNKVSFNCKLRGNFFSTMLWPECGHDGPVYPTNQIKSEMNAIEWENNFWNGGEDAGEAIEIVKVTGVYDSIPANNTNILYSGRVDLTQILEPVLGWTSSIISTVFAGTQIIIKINDTINWFSYQIDGGTPVKFKFTGAKYCIYGLTDTTHTLKITKLTQTDVETAFNGFELLTGKVLSAPTPLSSVKYEFIGSESVLGQSCEDPGYAGLLEYFNSQKSFCELMSTEHGADSHQIAKQSTTLINQNGLAYKDFYVKTKPYSNQNYTFGAWNPTAVFIILDSGDVSDYSQIAVFEEAFSNLIDLIRANNVDSYIITISPPRGFSNAGYITSINSIIAGKSDEKIAFVNIDAGGTLLSDSDFVYSTNYVTAAGHVKISNYISPIIAEIISGSIIHVVSMSLNKTSTSIVETYTEQLTVSFVPTYATDKTGVWASDDEDVVTVSNTGLMTGVAPGNAHVTFTSNDGGIVVSCAVEITAFISLIGVTIAAVTTPMVVGETQQLSLVFDPTNATDKTGVWSSSNEAVATVSQTGLVSAIADGSFRITFTSNDGGFAPYQDLTAYSQNDPNTVYFKTTGDTSIIQFAANTGDNSTATIYWSDSTTNILTFNDTAYKVANKSGLGTGIHEHTVVFSNPSNIKAISSSSGGQMKLVSINNLNILTGMLVMDYSYETALVSIGIVSALSVCRTYNFTSCSALTSLIMDRLFANMVTSNYTGGSKVFVCPVNGTIASHDDRATLIARGWPNISATP